MRKRMVNTDRDFYKYMGRVFGSREIQRVTYDRFYDDDAKEWIFEVKRNTVTAVISIKKSVIKNVFASDTFALIEILKEVYPEVSSGVVPDTYREIYTSAGYNLSEAGRKKKFIKITGGKSNGQNR